MIWWLAILIALVIIIVIMNFKYIMQEWKIILVLIIMLFLFVSIKEIIQDNDINIKSASGVINTAYYYMIWLGETGVQAFDVSKNTFNAVGNAIKGNTTQTK